MKKKNNNNNKQIEEEEGRRRIEDGGIDMLDYYILYSRYNNLFFVNEE